MSPQQAEQFASLWIDAWNAHDLDQVLALYHNDFSMASPYIAAIAGDASGSLHGKPAVRAYWQAALKRMPELHFQLIDYLCGVNSLVLHYRSVGGKLAAEYFEFDENGKVYRASAHYR